MIDIQLQLCFYMLIGFILGKLNMLSHTSKKEMSAMFVNVFIPCSTLSAFVMKMNGDILKEISEVLICSIVYEITACLLSMFIYKGFNGAEKANAAFGTVASNVSYVSYPILSSIYGDKGILYASILLIPQRVAMWTYGVSQYSKNEKVNVLKKSFLNPSMIAIYVGVIVCFLYNKGVTIPSFLINCCKAMGSGSTVLCMIVVGANISELNMKGILNIKSLYYCFIRLIFIPIIFVVLMNAFGVSDMAKVVVAICTAAPGAITMVALAEQYDKEPVFASNLVATSTVLSMITILLIEKLVLL